MRSSAVGSRLGRGKRVGRLNRYAPHGVHKGSLASESTPSPPFRDGRYSSTAGAERDHA